MATHPPLVPRWRGRPRRLQHCCCCRSMAPAAGASAGARCLHARMQEGWGLGAWHGVRRGGVIKKRAERAHAMPIAVPLHAADPWPGTQLPPPCAGRCRPEHAAVHTAVQCSTAQQATCEARICHAGVPPPLPSPPLARPPCKQQQPWCVLTKPWPKPSCALLMPQRQGASPYVSARMHVWGCWGRGRGGCVHLA